MTDARQQDLLNTASRLREQGHVPEAIKAYRALLDEFPDLPESWYNLGWLLRRSGRGQEALAAYEAALKHGVSGPEEVHLNRAAILTDMFLQHEAARGELDKALAINPGYLPALINLGNLHEDLGQRAEARAVYEKARTLKPGNPVVLSRLAGLSTASSPDDPLIGHLKALSGSGQLLPADHALVLFALGRLYDTCGAYGEAATTFAEAYAAARIAASVSVAPYDAVAEMLRADRLGAAFAAAGPRETGIAAPSPEPVFILGMFRSGSTLLEQILGAHSQVRAGGDFEMIPRMARGLGGEPLGIAQTPDAQLREYADAYLTRIKAMFPDAAMITDKRPDNFWHVGLIKRLFPKAKILNTLRHPLDNLVSVWGLYLDATLNYSYRLQDIAAHIHAERRMMAYWNELYPGDILTVKYEDVIARPEDEVRRVLEFLGLPFEAGCLDFHQSAAPVRTASVWQVREKLHDRSVGRWRHYEAYLRSLPADKALASLLAVEPPCKPE